MPDFPLYDNNIFEHLRQQSRMEQARFDYFHFKSQFWKRFQKDVLDQESPVVQHPEIGRPAYVTLSKTRSSYNWDTNNIEYNFTIYYYDDDEDREFPVAYSLSIPSSLEVDFSVAKYSEWISDRTVQVREKAKAKDMAIYERIKKRYNL